MSIRRDFEVGAVVGGPGVHRRFEARSCPARRVVMTVGWPKIKSRAVSRAAA